MLSGGSCSSHHAKDGLENAACHSAKEPHIKERESNNDYGT